MRHPRRRDPAQPGGSRTLPPVQVISQYRVDAPADWVRSFLLAGTSEDDVTVEGDVIEVRQHDRLVDLVVRNTVIAGNDGGTVIDVNAELRLLGLARVVGGLFHRRVRRTLERALDRLPAAMERALEGNEDLAAQADVGDEAAGELAGPDGPTVPG